MVSFVQWLTTEKTEIEMFITDRSWRSAKHISRGQSGRSGQSADETVRTWGDKSLLGSVGKELWDFWAKAGLVNSNQEWAFGKLPLGSYLRDEVKALGGRGGL